MRYVKKYRDHNVDFYKYDIPPETVAQVKMEIRKNVRREKMRMRRVSVGAFVVAYL